MGNDLEFIAFDIECSVNFNDYCEICLFGYVRTDCNLNEIDHGEIYVNAKRPHGKLKKLLQNVDFEKVELAPDYRQQYREIMDILNTNNAILVAHSADSDLRFLFYQNERFALDNFSGRVFDTLRMAIDHSPELNNHSVIQLCKSWNIEHEIEHEALSDAYSCIHFIKHISETDHVSPVDVFNTYKEKSYIDSEEVYRQIVKRRLKKKLDNLAVHRRIPNTICFCLDEPFEMEKVEQAEELAWTIIDLGCNFSFRLALSDYLIADENSMSKKYQYAVMKGIEIISPEQVEEFIYNNRTDIKITYK